MWGSKVLAMTLDMAGGVKVLERLASKWRDWASMESV